MNTKTLLITALAAAFSGAAFADVKSHAELQIEAQLSKPSTTTREAVMNRFLQARANGTLIGHPDYGPRTRQIFAGMDTDDDKSFVAVATTSRERTPRGGH